MMKEKMLNITITVRLITNVTNLRPQQTIFSPYENRYKARVKDRLQQPSSKGVKSIHVEENWIYLSQKRSILHF